MILVDSSVLISFFRGKENQSTSKLEQIISEKIPFGINGFIYQEILQGASTEKDYKILKTYLETQKFYHLINGIKSYEAAASIYFKCRKSGITIRSTIDTLIAQTAIENGLMLLHNDSDFTNMAKIIPELRTY